MTDLPSGNAAATNFRPTYRTGGFQAGHGMCLAATSFSGIEITLLRSELQPARCVIF
jgi:hypothetical protein